MKILGWLVAAVAFAALIVVVFNPKGGGGPTDGPGSDPGPHTPLPPPPKPIEDPPKPIEDPPTEPIEVPPVTEEDVNQLPQDVRKMRGLVEMTGHAARAENGYEVSGDFYYVTEVTYESHVKDRSVTPMGEVRVTETRRYEQCKDQITYGEFDFKVNLDTLPIRQVAPYVAGVADVVGGCLGFEPGVGAALVASGVEALYSIDGVSAKKTLSLLSGFFGGEVPQDITSWVNGIIAPDAKRLHAEVKQAVQKISGNTYVVTYYQNAAGEPMRVKFERQDGKPLSMDEYRILREMNVFLSCHVIPSKGPAVGESWEVDVAELPGMFDSLSGGNDIQGKLIAKRLEDEKDGMMKIDLSGGRVAVLNDNGMEDGSFLIDKGAALASPRDNQISAFQLTGHGKLRMEEAKKRFLVLDFIKRTDGDCQVRMTLASESKDYNK